MREKAAPELVEPIVQAGSDNRSVVLILGIEQHAGRRGVELDAEIVVSEIVIAAGNIKPE
jgi:hypothetical protein